MSQNGGFRKNHIAQSVAAIVLLLLQAVHVCFNPMGACGHGYLYPKENLAGLMVDSLLSGGKDLTDVAGWSTKDRYD
jgi:hypothetical protein